MAVPCPVYAWPFHKAKQPEPAPFKIKATTWREEQANPENPSDLTLNTRFPDQNWWSQFNDPILTGYIQEALKANNQLAIAEARIREERALARVALGQEFPTLTLGGTFNRQKNSQTLTSPSSRQFSGGSGGAFFPGKTVNFYTVPLEVSYEADIWHAKRDVTRAQAQRANASERDYQTAVLTLVTDVSTAYFNLMAADKLITLQNQYVAFSQDDLLHTTQRFEAGLVSEEDVVIKQGLLADAKAQRQDYFQLQALNLNLLSILLGKTPEEVSTLPRGDLDNFSVPDNLSTGVPSELIARRPDILSAEDELTASNIDVRIARKQFLPSLNLTGQFGFSSTMLDKLFNWDSHIASFGASLLETLFTGGSRKANVNVYKARYEQQLHQYQQTILQAFREVDDALASVKSHRNAYEEYQLSLGTLSKRLTIQQNRLNAGAISPADIDPTQKEMTLSQEGLVRTKLAALADTLSLYKALGGGY